LEIELSCTYYVKQAEKQSLAEKLRAVLLKE